MAVRGVAWRDMAWFLNSEAGNALVWPGVAQRWLGLAWQCVPWQCSARHGSARLLIGGAYEQSRLV